MGQEEGVLPRVSVVICAYTDRRWSQLKRAVDSVRSQSVAPHEVIVVIDHNPELAVRAATGLDAIVVENRGTKGLSDARNTGIGVASGEIIAFLDDDAHAGHRWLESLVSSMADPGIIGIGGMACAEWETKRPGWFPQSFDWVVGCSYEGLPDQATPVRNVIGCNMAFRASAFDAVGGFESDMGRIGTLPLGCEETELCIRIGTRYGPGSVFYDPSAVVGHSVPAERGTWRYFVTRCYSEGISKAAVVRRTGAGPGLASERTHALMVLPRALMRSLGETITRRDIWGAGRAAAIVLGFGATALGYLRGSWSEARRGHRTETPAVIGAR